MPRIAVVLLVLVAMAGCAKSDEFPGGLARQAKAPSATGPARTLAYQHAIGLDVDESKVAAVFEAGQAACRAASADACVVLESRIATGRYASASLKFRASPGGIQKLITALAQQGEIASQSTTAEDLAAPIEDATKKRAMLNDYRAKLESLLARANSDVDALIKLNRELAQVQGELEALAGKQAHLVQRVETEVLDVTITSTHHQSFWAPIGASVSDFGKNLSQGTSIAITGVAYLTPWGVALLFLTWVGGALWRRRKRRQAQG
jgi:hypothetical protein